MNASDQPRLSTESTPREVRDGWVIALRSGQYEQGQNVLHQEMSDQGTIDERYCCLGVLCDLAVEAGVIGTPALVEASTGESVYEYGTRGQATGSTSYTELPLEVQRWVGLASANGRYFGPAKDAPADSMLSDDEGTATRFLANDNDDGTPFEVIADVIEAAPDGLVGE